MNINEYYNLCIVAAFLFLLTSGKSVLFFQIIIII